MGYKMQTFPQYHEPWGKCSWCGFDYPRHNLRLHRRFGWQCKWCWDAGPHHDELFYTPRPYEGSRRTAAPLTNTLTEGDNAGGIAYVFRDQTTGQFWTVLFGYTGDVTVDTGGHAGASAWLLSPYPQWRWYLSNGNITVNNQPISGEQMAPGEINLTVSVDGVWSYAP